MIGKFRVRHLITPFRKPTRQECQDSKVSDPVMKSFPKHPKEREGTLLFALFGSSCIGPTLGQELRGYDTARWLGTGIQALGDLHKGCR